VSGGFVTLHKRYFFSHFLYPPVELFGNDFNCKVGTPEFALHAFDTGLQVFDSRDKALHLQDLSRAKLYTDMTSLAVLLDNLDFWQFFLHLARLLYFRNKRCGFSAPKMWQKKDSRPSFAFTKEN
jgi:hypothetical protein